MVERQSGRKLQIIAPSFSVAVFFFCIGALLWSGVIVASQTSEALPNDPAAAWPEQPGNISISTIELAPPQPKLSKRCVIKVHIKNTSQDTIDDYEVMLSIVDIGSSRVIPVGRLVKKALQPGDNVVTYVTLFQTPSSYQAFARVSAGSAWSRNSTNDSHHRTLVIGE